jgi:hypothetical protein
MKETSSAFLGCLVQIIYFLMGLLQLAAIMGGIEDWWGFPWWVAIFIAFSLAYIPIVGTIVGIMGAIEAFGWSPVTAITLFCWPYIIYIAILLITGSLAFLGSSRQK